MNKKKSSNNKLECKWMTLNLRSPFIIASLTLVSNVSIAEHVKYYKKVYDMGAGAIVLPSINPCFEGKSDINETVADCLTFGTGLGGTGKMGFSVLGPVEPNIISLKYGINLAQKVKDECEDIAVIGSVIDLGTKADIVNAVSALCKTGVDGIELNISCPNVNAAENDQCIRIQDILEQIRKKHNVPISLKISPQKDYTKLLTIVGDVIDGLTLSNAYVGLIPPNIEDDSFSPFKRRTEWSPSGVYGPFERMLTFKTIYSFRKLADEKKLSIACVGGIVSVQDAIQALMLGADVVQLSSAVLWSGVSVFDKYNKSLLRYMETKAINVVYQIKGSALKYIKDSSNDLKAPRKRKMRIDNNKCKKCLNCMCCDRLCIAIHQNSNDHSVYIDKELCSGCGMCMELCPNSAILEYVDRLSESNSPQFEQ